MPENQRNRQRRLRVALPVIVFMAILCGGAAACTATGNADADFMLTNLPGTAEGIFFPARSTSSSEDNPQDDPDDDDGELFIEEPSADDASAAPTATPESDADCINQAGAGRPIDVNIPDDTIMEPGQDFRKTWRLVNNGTCTWTEDYQVIWFWGADMSREKSFSLPHRVEPGEEAEISVDLTAPNKPGTYQSSWKLRSTGGEIFGVGSGEGLYFYVRIVVANTPSLPTAAITTSQATPTPYAGGPTRLLPDDRIDLDRNQLNPTSGEDIAMNGGQPYYLVPFEGAYISVYGTTQPGEDQCLATAPSKSPILVDKLSPNTYLCYLTNEGRSGWMRVQSFWAYQERALLNLQVNTFPMP